MDIVTSRIQVWIFGKVGVQFGFIPDVILFDMFYIFVFMHLKLTLFKTWRHCNADSIFNYFHLILTVKQYHMHSFMFTFQSLNKWFFHKYVFIHKYL